MAGIGLSDAVSGFINTQQDVADRAYQASMRQRQMRQMDQQDAITADAEAGRQAGIDYLAKKRATWESQQGGLIPPGDAQPLPAAASKFGSRDAPQIAIQPSITDANAGLASPSPTQKVGQMPTARAPRAYEPQPDDILGAFDASSKELAKRGRWDEWAKTWSKSAEVRTALRNQALDQAETEYRNTGDPLVFARKAYKYIDDGQQFVRGEKVTGADGKEAYSVTRKNQSTGEEETRAMTADDLLRGVAFARDPQAVRKAEADHAMETRKALIKVEEERLKQKDMEERQLNINKQKQLGDLELAKTKDGIDASHIRLRGAIDSGQIAQRGGEERKTVGFRDGLDRTKPYTMAEGGTRVVDVPQPDGSLKPTSILKIDKTQKADKGTSAAQLSSMAGRLFTDPVSGRTLNSERLSKVTAAASILTANGMEANQAIRKAAVDLGFSK